jgi:hypothetical protein
LRPPSPAQEPGLGSDGHHTLLLIDQFEELFTLCTDDLQRKAFDAALWHSVEHGDEAFSLLLTLRSDFYSQTADLTLRELIATYQLHVRNLHVDEMQQAIRAPVREIAGAGPPQFEAGLVESCSPKRPARALARCHYWSSP